MYEKAVPTSYNNTQTAYSSHTSNYSTPQPGYGRTGGRGNLTELDTLLDDLSNARYGNYVDKTSYNERTGKYHA